MAVPVWVSDDTGSWLDGSRGRDEAVPERGLPPLTRTDAVLEMLASAILELTRADGMLDIPVDRRFVQERVRAGLAYVQLAAEVLEHPSNIAPPAGG